MIKYYTRACNFYYGHISKEKIKKKISLPLNGNKLISFDTIELISRQNKKLIRLNDIKKLPINLRKKIFNDLKQISKTKNISKLKYKKSPLLMGILNTTPDSFSDGGKYLKSNLAKRQIKKLKKDGADIIDIGGESTRPNSKTVKSMTEWMRVKSKIKFAKRNKIFVSLDTRKSFVLKNSLPMKIDLLNDVSGLSYDKEIIKILKRSKIPFILHHMQGTPNTMQKNPKYKNVLLDIYDFFEERIKKVNDKKVILDPGIGFGKVLKHNLTLISKISLFHSLGFPILVGTSRKRFINQISGSNDSKDRTGGTLASVLYLLSQGVQVFRVHNVNEIKQAIEQIFKVKVLKINTSIDDSAYLLGFNKFNKWHWSNRYVFFWRSFLR